MMDLTDRSVQSQRDAGLLSAIASQVIRTLHHTSGHVARTAAASPAKKSSEPQVGSTPASIRIRLICLTHASLNNERPCLLSCRPFRQKLCSCSLLSPRNSSLKVCQLRVCAKAVAWIITTSNDAFQRDFNIPLLVVFNCINESESSGCLVNVVKHD